MKRTGHLIREARIKLGVSQSAVSSVIGVKGDAYISRVETGRQSLANRHIRKVAAFLKIDVAELLEAKIQESENQTKGGK